MSDSPYTSPPEQNLVSVNFALPVEMRDYIRQCAASNDISFTECVVCLLIEGMQAVDTQMRSRAAEREQIALATTVLGDVL